MAFTGWGPATSNTDTSSLSLGSSTTPSRGMMDSGKTLLGALSGDSNEQLAGISNA